MPGMGGVAMVKALRGDARTSQVRILMLTSESSVESETEGLAAGADDYILKPVEPRRLAARVKALRARSRRSAPGRRAESTCASRNGIGTAAERITAAGQSVGRFAITDHQTRRPSAPRALDGDSAAGRSVWRSLPRSDVDRGAAGDLRQETLLSVFEYPLRSPVAGRNSQEMLDASSSKSTRFDMTTTRCRHAGRRRCAVARAVELHRGTEQFNVQGALYGRSVSLTHESGTETG